MVPVLCSPARKEKYAQSSLVVIQSHKYFDGGSIGPNRRGQVHQPLSS